MIDEWKRKNNMEESSEYQGRDELLVLIVSSLTNPSIDKSDFHQKKKVSFEVTSALQEKCKGFLFAANIKRNVTRTFAPFGKEI